MGTGWDWASQTMATGRPASRCTLSNFDLGGSRGGTLPTGSVAWNKSQCVNEVRKGEEPGNLHGMLYCIVFIYFLLEGSGSSTEAAGLR